MNTELQIFKSDEFGELRVVEKGGEPWFVASDVAKMLELSDIRHRVLELSADEKGVCTVHTLGGNQAVTTVSESGLYKLIFQSRKPEAKKVIDWVTREVMPSIRKHGAYMTPDTIQKVLTNPDFIIQLATQLKESQKQVASLTEEKKKNAPKVLFADTVEATGNCILIEQLSKEISNTVGTDMGKKKLHTFLRVKKLTYDCGDEILPTAKATKNGWLKTKVSTFTIRGKEFSRRTTVVTPKGQVAITELVIRHLAEESIKGFRQARLIKDI
jgi:anti-repressor protein